MAIRVGETVLLGRGSLFLTGVVLSIKRVVEFNSIGYIEIAQVRLSSGKVVYRRADALRSLPQKPYYSNTVVPMTAMEQMAARYK